MKTATKRPDLVAMTQERGEFCYREIKGVRIYDFKRVIITVTNADGSRKKYYINRATCGHGKFIHYIETHTIPADNTWWDERQNGRFKWYDDSNFNAKLHRLAREIAKTNHDIRVV